MNWKKITLWGIGALVVVFLGIQLVPYVRQHENPSVTNEVGWGDPAVREVAVTACYEIATATRRSGPGTAILHPFRG